VKPGRSEISHFILFMLEYEVIKLGGRVSQRKPFSGKHSIVSGVNRVACGFNYFIFDRLDVGDQSELEGGWWATRRSGKLITLFL
jgi:hypothetical protein